MNPKKGAAEVARGKLRRLCGFTLAESLLVVLLLSFVSGGLAVGVAFATRQYTRSMLASESRILYSTLMNAISAELGNAREVKAPDGVVTSFYTQNYPQVVGTDGFSNGTGKDAGKLFLNNRPLVDDAAYARGMKAYLAEPVAYAGGVFRVHLRIEDRTGGTLVDQSFDVIPLNPGEISTPS